MDENEKHPSTNFKEFTIHFLQLTASDNVNEAYEHVASNFIHHNPYFANDAATLQAGMLENVNMQPNII